MKARSVTITAQEIQKLVGGTLHGAEDFIVRGLSTLEAPQAATVVFFRGSSEKKLQEIIDQSPPLFILVGFVPENPTNNSSCLLRVDNPQESFIRLVETFYESDQPLPHVSPSAIIHPSVKLGNEVYIGPHVILDADVTLGDGVKIHGATHLYRGVTVGANSVLYSGVRIREDCVIGSNCTLHSNSVIGADGFGYLPAPSGGLLKVPQVGFVVIEDEVEIGALTSIDRGTVGPTIIGRGTKIDNQVQIGHNVQIGKCCIICAQVGIAGSAVISDGVVLGGGVGVADHIHIARGVRVGGHSGVVTNLHTPGDYMGMPAIKASLFKRTQVYLKKLRETRNRPKSM
jgi:UDP-3-O-[3-hydroxymyristoyl] glucosamine N-acyltransferase